jgi:hypothetical protein
MWLIGLTIAADAKESLDARKRLAWLVDKHGVYVLAGLVRRRGNIIGVEAMRFDNVNFADAQHQWRERDEPSTTGVIAQRPGAGLL